MTISSKSIDSGSRPLPWLLALYGLASLAHFMHNAEYLNAYPNLPAWLSRSEIYGAWCAITATGLAGYALCRRGRVLAGYSLLILYTSLGFDGLLHYRRAPLASHSVAMNLTIWCEVAAAALALIAVAAAAARQQATVGSDRW
jgi:hypothetical protein